MNVFAIVLIILPFICTAIPVPTLTPTASPSIVPTLNPSASPSIKPTAAPSNSYRPTYFPSSTPSSAPSQQPSSEPSMQPSSTPSGQPTAQPSFEPTSPTSQPTSVPSGTHDPTGQPSSQPTFSPTGTQAPTEFVPPTSQPSSCPSSQPSSLPSSFPSSQPTFSPSQPSGQPTSVPSMYPTGQPSGRPSLAPTSSPTSPTSFPTSKPSGVPTAFPSCMPSSQPSCSPSSYPSSQPTTFPTVTPKPSGQPSSCPSMAPSSQPSSRPTGSPTQTVRPTKRPTSQPSSFPSGQPSSQPSSQPTVQPTSIPSNPSSQPTTFPSSQPSSVPSSVPSGQPSSVPSSQPSGQPTYGPSQPSGQPSSCPSLCPTSQPTTTPSISPKPSGQPSSCPSFAPSNQPTSRPTSFPTNTYQPSGFPTRAPIPRPTPMPTYPTGLTRSPTYFYQGVDVDGTVTFEPDNSESCNAVELTIRVSFSKNISSGATFDISTPGLTSGPCTYQANGEDIESLSVPNTADFTGSFTEGSYTDNFDDSKITLVSRGISIQSFQEYTFIIDRSNLLRRSCSSNSTWSVSITPTGFDGGISGYLDRIELFPKKCFLFFASLEFSNPYPQFLNGINFTFRLGFHFAWDTKIIIHLPGFTNAKGAYGLNSMVENSTDFVGNGADATLSGLTWNTNFTWVGEWEEGDYSDNFQESRIILTAKGYSPFNKMVWVNIDKASNHIIPVCGHPPNSENLRISSISPQFFINSSFLTNSTAIGSGCNLLNNCNGNGFCDYCTLQCRCNDGFGSDFDREKVIADNFQPDCSSKTCPLGPSMGTLLNFSVPESFDLHAHREIECSNNGICDRRNGFCKCFDGFTGAACEKMKCPGTPECNGRGRCVPMNRLPSYTEALPLSNTDALYLNLNKTSFTAWDYKFGHLCICDSEWAVGLGLNQTQQSQFFGLGCQYRRCPSGDDPTTSVDETDCTGLNLTGGKDLGEEGNLCHVDCANQGICNHDTGICKCFKGFGGVNCATILR